MPVQPAIKTRATLFWHNRIRNRNETYLTAINKLTGKETLQTMSDALIEVDAHQHYWQIQQFVYPWHKQVNLPQMNRDYMPPDILPQMQALGVSHSVLIQADNSLEETAWMLDLARQYPHIAGVVGWVDLAAADVAETLAQMVKDPLFKGIRLMPVPQNDWSALQIGLRAFAELDLSCDVLPNETTLPLMIEMMRANQGTRFVVNHCAGLPLVPGGSSLWAQKLKPLAELPNVYLKFSAIQGLAEPSPITAETVLPHLENALQLFGTERLLLASDWPVSTLSGPYNEWHQIMRETTTTLSLDEQRRLWGQTAATVYKLVF